MKITILYDNTATSENIVPGWGFSCLIDRRILFDTGDDPAVLMSNGDTLGVDINSIESVVLSHEHWDHTGGLWDLLSRREGLPVYVCPGFSGEFKEKVRRHGGKLIEAASRTELDPVISTTGEIPSIYKGMSMPEQALMIHRGDGIVLITGCSHPGILAMIRTAQSLMPGKAVLLALGGFHLFREEEEAVTSLAEEMKALGVWRVAPTHCTGDGAQEIFRRIYGPRYIGISAGTTIDLDEMMQS